MESRVKEKILNSFKAEYVGRGLWYVQHKSVSSLPNDDINNDSLIGLFYDNFYVYCENIYCLACRKHAAQFLVESKVNKIFLNSDISRKEKYFDWLYNFHFEANKNAGKNSPEKDKVYDYYFNGINCEEINNNDFTFDKIQAGIWHFFFLLITKCKNVEDICKVWIYLMNLFPNLENRQKLLYLDFVTKHSFLQALLNKDIEFSELAIAFFDWLYMLYGIMNRDFGIEVYPKDELRSVYYNLTYCSEKCDK